MVTAKPTTPGMQTVNLRRSYTYAGKPYGPGQAIEVPEGLAAALGLAPTVPPTDPDADATRPETGRRAGRKV